MSSVPNRSNLSVAMLVATLLLWFSDVLRLNVYGEDMPAKSAHVEQVFAKTKSICFGRFVIDVPETAQVIYGPSSAPWPIEAYPGKGDLIDSVVEKRLVEVQDEKKFVEGDLRNDDSLVGKIINGSVPGQMIVLGVSKASGGIYRIDSFTKVGNTLFIQQAEAIPSRRESTVRDMNTVASLLSERSNSDVPTQPGTCIEAGFIAEPYKFTYEAFSLGVRLSELPDVHFSVSVTRKDRLVQSDALEPRLRQAEEIARKAGQGAWYARIKTLRRGPHEVGKWKGFEMLARMPSQPAEGESHEFTFLSQGSPDNQLLPVLEIELHSGVKGDQLGGTKPSVSDEEAVEIWDKLTTSIRSRIVRPN